MWDTRTENSDTDFINLTEEYLVNEHLCCIIRSRKLHPGVEAKRKWLTESLKEGYVFRKIKVWQVKDDEIKAKIVEKMDNHFTYNVPVRR